MTEKEQYKAAFSALRPSDGLNLEVEHMANLRKKNIIKATATALAVSLLVFGGSGAAYAANIGNIQRTVQIWMNGDQTDANLEISGDGTYTLTFVDVDGVEHTRGGGGKAFDMFGNEVPLTEEQIMQQLQMPEVLTSKDGRVIVYYFDQTLDITDNFKNGKCHVQLENASTGDTVYLTVYENGGYAFNTSKYTD